MVMYSLSLGAILFVLLTGALGKLTNDDHYKKRGKSSFIRGGMLGKIFNFLKLYIVACSNINQPGESLRGSDLFKKSLPRGEFLEKVTRRERHLELSK